MVNVELAEVQGLILRGYTVPVARYFGLSVRESADARALLAAFINSDPAVPSITTAQPWAVKPGYCVNLGITFPGRSLNTSLFRPRGAAPEAQRDLF